MRVYFLLFTLVFNSLISAQTPAASSAAIQAQEMAALCPQGPVTDVLLTGTASWTMGSDNQSGTITMKARSQASRVDLALGGGVRSEIRINDPLNPLFETSARGGKWTTRAIHNSWVDANWFFPALSSLIVGLQNGFNLGTVSDPSHLFSQFQIPAQKPVVTSQIQSISTVVYDIDPSSKLPTAMHFFAHPDEDFGVNIPVDVQFSGYKPVNGVQVPFHIQRYYNGTLQLDITIFTVTINPGLTAADFIAN